MVTQSITTEAEAGETSEMPARTTSPEHGIAGSFTRVRGEMSKGKARNAPEIKGILVKFLRPKPCRMAALHP
jgi:hypothetical protein